MLVKETKKYYVFEGNNKYSKQNYTLEDAEKLAITLLKCVNCIDCEKLYRVYFLHILLSLSGLRTFNILSKLY